MINAVIADIGALIEAFFYDEVRPQPAVQRRAGGCIARSGKLDKASSRLYRSEILQVNMRSKALAEIYTMRSFAQLLESIICET